MTNDEHKESAINQAKDNIKGIRELINEVEQAVLNEGQLACMATEVLGHWMENHWKKQTEEYFNVMTGKTEIQ